MSEEGDRCQQEGCAGHLVSKPVENCSCHIHAPCSRCTDNPLECDTCDFVEKIEFANGYRNVVGPNSSYTSWRPRALDRTKIDWRYEPHTHFTMKKIGVYPEGTTPEQVEKEVRGTFGGRFEAFGNGEFVYVAYTD